MPQVLNVSRVAVYQYVTKLRQKISPQRVSPQLQKSKHGGQGEGSRPSCGPLPSRSVGVAEGDDAAVLDRAVGHDLHDLSVRGLAPDRVAAVLDCGAEGSALDFADRACHSAGLVVGRLERRQDGRRGI